MSRARLSPDQHSNLSPFAAQFIGCKGDKLLCRSSESAGLKPDESLACLAVHLGLDFKATSWLDRMAERAQVERDIGLSPCTIEIEIDIQLIIDDFNLRMATPMLIIG